MQETSNIFRTGEYHRSFKSKHTQLMHFTRSIQLRIFYTTCVRLLQRRGWPDPLARTAPQVLLCGTASPYTTCTFARFVNKLSTTASIDVLDISPYALSQSAQFLKTCRDLNAACISFVEGDACGMPFANERFDWIETDFFIQFFSAQEKVTIFQEWYRVLKPGGVITTRDWLLVKHDFVERVVEGTKNWLIRHILGPVTYTASGEDVQETLRKLGFAAAMFPVSIPGIKLTIPGMKYLLIYKPVSAGADAATDQ
ncbi:MAG: class I SAM-dependent methyltransferase [Ktedonobacterales bacterium]